MMPFRKLAFVSLAGFQLFSATAASSTEVRALDFCDDIQAANNTWARGVNTDNNRAPVQITGVDNGSPAMAMAEAGKYLSENAGRLTGNHEGSQIMDDALGKYFRQFEPGSAKHLATLTRQAIAADKIDLKTVPFDQIDSVLAIGRINKETRVNFRTEADKRMFARCRANGYEFTFPVQP